MSAFVSGFAGATAVKSASGLRLSSKKVTKVANISMMAKSKSVPFMDEPPALAGYAANYGFDPLYITSWLDIKWLRESEIKHGRICMLAVVGWFVQEFFQFPFYPGAPALPTAAHGKSHHVSSLLTTVDSRMSPFAKPSRLASRDLYLR